METEAWQLQRTATRKEAWVLGFHSANSIQAFVGGSAISNESGTYRKSRGMAHACGKCFLFMRIESLPIIYLFTEYFAILCYTNLRMATFL